MNTTYYVVDNNALIKIGRERRTTDFFAQYCHLTADVAYEARYLRPAVPTATYPVTPSILHDLREVMSTVQPGDTTLVDLYNNRGMADPVMVATVLDLTRREQSLLLADNWIIVTLDKALTYTAEKHELKTMTPEELAKIIDEASA